LLRIRDLQAAKLEVEPSVIGSRASLVGLAAEHSDNGDKLMRWQRELLAQDPGPQVRVATVSNPGKDPKGMENGE
jgi:hypothetical protein